MTTIRISGHLPPNIDCTKAPIAFGRRAVPKLNEELQNPELITRQRALMSLCDLVHDPEIALEAMRLGCLESLKRLLGDVDSTVRMKTTEIFYRLTTHNVGRIAFLKSDVILPLSQLFDEPVDVCRKNMHMAIEMMSEFPGGAVGLVEAGLIPRLVFKLTSELEEIQELILDTLHFCLCVDASEALASEAVSVLKEKLSHRSARIRSKAARALMDISVPLEGKNKLCEEEVIPILVNLLGDPSPEVAASAAGALMSATVTTPGKYAALNADALPPLLGLVRSPQMNVCLNAVKAITVLAEAPEGRKELLKHLDLLEDLRGHDSEVTRRAAETAMRVITWKP
ncbi:radial spoke head 14 homolog isoform X2 [Acipenser ruthenus]|uniref:radial spoke head 14 homolog isoform X2 n=1 Tax=Acipenser ruthenus TaxID=7906 RepID=UPI001561627B|nr:radial spoke head 14 homolog isoform X2 [Acipenser ruthenus]